MFEPIFERVGEELIARLPRDPEGILRRADGIRHFSLDQAAAYLKKPAKLLLDQYMAAFGELLEAQAKLDAAYPASAGCAEAHLAPGDDAGGSAVAAESSPLRHAAADVLRALQFPDLDDREFEQVVAFCRARRLGLWARHVWTRRQWDADAKQLRLVIMTTIDGIRAIAHDTGLYAGCDAVELEFDSRSQEAEPSERPWPVKASQTVYRLIGGARQPFVGTVLWEDYYQLPQGSPAYRDMMPGAWLAKCAEAVALRRAFPEKLAGIYSLDEFAGLPAGAPAGQAPTSPASTPTPAASAEATSDPYDGGDDISVEIDEDTPASWQQFEQTLADRGLTQGSRGRLIEQYRRRFSTAYRANNKNPRLFFAKLLQVVEREEGARA